MKFLAILFACLISPLAFATTVTTDFTDMWWVGAAENGWGTNLIQQGDTIFVTLFVYGPSGQATWYVGPATTFQGTVNGAQLFIGPLYQVTGTYFGASTFDPNATNVRQVGSVTFSAPQVSSATLAYTADGVNVSKQIVRQTWRTDNLAGGYIGATIGSFTGCASNNGPVEAGAAYSLTQSGNSVVITEAASNYQCTYTGALTQTGRMGSIAGTANCTDLGPQDFAATEVQAGLDFLSMRMDFSHGSCRFSGRMGGIRRVSSS